MASHHDALFRSTFSSISHATGLLKSVLPAELAASIDWSTLRLAPGELVDAHLSERRTDLLYEVELRGVPAFLFVLLEHQSSVEPMMAARVFTYVGRIWDRWRRGQPNATQLPPIVPLVLYHGRQPWSAATSVTELMGVEAPPHSALAVHLPALRFLLDDLSTQDEAALRSRVASALTRLVLLVLRQAMLGGDIAQELRRWADLVREVHGAADGGEALSMVLRYVLLKTEVAPEAVERFVVQEVGEQAREVYVTAAQRIAEEALARGHAEGRAEGKAEGKAELVARLLQLRFGELPQSVQDRLASATVEQLDTWAERVLTAPSLDSVFEQS